MRKNWWNSTTQSYHSSTLQTTQVSQLLINGTGPAWKRSSSAATWGDVLPAIQPSTSTERERVERDGREKCRMGKFSFCKLNTRFIELLMLLPINQQKHLVIVYRLIHHQESCTFLGKETRWIRNQGEVRIYARMKRVQAKRSKYMLFVSKSIQICIKDS